jgi:hypothetical protein
MSTLRDEWRRMQATLIVISHHLQTPYTSTDEHPDAAEWTPWSRFVLPRAEAMRSAVTEALAERDALRAQVERVRALHRPWIFPSNAVGVRHCWTCRKKGGRLVKWPCPTGAALDGQAEGEAHAVPRCPVCRHAPHGNDTCFNMASDECDSGDFDRTVCPEPCGAMHSYCTGCGSRADECAHEAEGEAGR